MKIYKTRDKRQCRDQILVVIQPDPESPAIIFRRFNLCYVPGWPDDVEAAKEWLHDQACSKPDGKVPALVNLYLKDWEEADDEIDAPLAALRRFYELIYWEDAQEAIDWTEENINSIPEIRGAITIILAALVELRDSDDLINRRRFKETT